MSSSFHQDDLDVLQTPSKHQQQQQQQHQHQHQQQKLEQEDDAQHHDPLALHSNSSLPFFADATLDLETAHDICETPDATTRTLTLLGTTPQQQQQSSSTSSRYNAATAAGVAATGAAGSSSSSPLDFLPGLPLSTTQEEEQDDNNNHENPKNNDNLLPPQLTSRVQPSSPLFHTLEQEPQSSDHDYNNSNDSNSKSTFARLSAAFNSSRQRRRRLPTVARDWPWAVAFMVVVPLSLGVFPALFTSSTPSLLLWPATLRATTVHALLWATGLVILASRVLYAARAGPEGDEARHVMCELLVACLAVSVAVYAVCTIAVWAWLPHTTWLCVVPLWFAVRHFFLLRQWRRSDGGRQEFLRALCRMALDILAKSLRAKPLARVLMGVLGVQTLNLLVWRWALIRTCGAARNEHAGHWIWFLLALVGGKWLSGTTARLLTLLASGGVMNWFVEQSAAVAALPGAAKREYNNDNDSNDNYDDEYNECSQQQQQQQQSDEAYSDMPEAYRTVDASVYQSVMMEVDNDVLLNDDEEDEDEEEGEFSGRRRTQDRETWTHPGIDHGRRSQSTPSSSSSQRKNKATVKSLLTAGLTVSFGSVAQCGLVGGLAQFVWSQVRKISFAQSVWTRLREGQQQFSRQSSQAMQIGGQASHEGGTSSSRSSSSRNSCRQVWTVGLRLARHFVRGHSDLAMPFVAAYYKNYNKAAQEVAALVDQSGVEPILEQDISTHMCSCVGGSLSGVIVLFTGYVMLQLRQKTHDITDWQVFEHLLLAFILCYTLIFTLMEPLRASIKTVYVGFAQYPESLSQAYPIIYQRLQRLSESNSGSLPYGN